MKCSPFDRAMMLCDAPKQPDGFPISWIVLAGLVILISWLTLQAFQTFED